MKKFKFALILLALIGAFALAQVYKWVDEQGNIHFGDKPPEKDNVEELVLPEGPSPEELKAAEEELRAKLESRKSRDQIQEEQERESRSKGYAEDLMAEERFNQCVEARHQVMVLERRGRAFKLRPDWTRSYLENEDRPVEIARLEKLVDDNCDTDTKSVQEQDVHLLELIKALNIRCITAWETLHKSNDPAADIANQKVEEAQEYIDEKCPSTEIHNLWIADWIFVR